MKINKESEYAIRIVKYLSEIPENKLIGSKEISEKEEISINMTTKILRFLANYGIIESYRGTLGGYRLKRDKVSYYEIIKAIQGELYILNDFKSLEQKENEVKKNLWKIQKICKNKLYSLEIKKNFFDS